MKNLVLAALFVVVSGSSAFANEWGSRSNNTLGNDSFRSSNGSECSINRETGSNLNVGTFAKESYQGEMDQGIFVEFSFKLGKQRSRIDCNRLYDLEVERQSLEIEKLKAELELLRASGNTNTGSDW